METAAPSFQEFAALLRHEIAEVRSPLRREFIERLLVAPHQVTLHWEYGNAETYQAWVFANMPDGDVVAQYCRGGFGAMGKPWGIRFQPASHFGQDSGWYPSLDALIEEWVYPDDL